MTQETTPAKHVWKRKSKTLSTCAICRETTRHKDVIPDDCHTDDYSNRMRAAAMRPPKRETQMIRRGRCEDCGNFPGYGYGGRVTDPGGCECTSGPAGRREFKPSGEKKKVEPPKPLPPLPTKEEFDRMQREREQARLEEEWSSLRGMGRTRRMF